MRRSQGGRAMRAGAAAVIEAAMISACDDPKTRPSPGSAGTTPASQATANLAPATQPPATAPTANPAPGSPGGADAALVEPYVVKGRVTTAAGDPIPGVEVYADNTLLYNSGLLGVSDADGYYRIDLSPMETTWQIWGQHGVEWEEEWFRFPLAYDHTAFSSSAGAIRDLTWQLSGIGDRALEIYHGGTVYVYEDWERYDIPDMNWVAVTFAPEGPLIDGSAGATITRSVELSTIEDVPVGRYTVTAELQPPGEPAEPLNVRVRDEGDYAPSVSAGFEPAPVDGALLELQIRRR